MLACLRLPRACAKPRSSGRRRRASALSPRPRRKLAPMPPLAVPCTLQPSRSNSKTRLALPNEGGRPLPLGGDPPRNLSGVPLRLAWDPRHVTQVLGHVTRALGHVTQALGHVTQALRHVTQVSHRQYPFGAPHGDRECTSGNAGPRLTDLPGLPCLRPAGSRVALERARRLPLQLAPRCIPLSHITHFRADVRACWVRALLLGLLV